MGWKYEQLEAEGIRPAELICTCGHNGEEHHAVYWPLGMTLDECEFYGSNETGGMKPTWTGWFFWRVMPPKQWHYDRDDDGKVILPGRRTPQRVRDFTRRYLLRRPWFIDHCHHFENAGEGETR